MKFSKKTKFFLGLTYDDVLLVPQYSTVLPNNVDVSTHLTKNIILKTPIISAAMSTVTEADMAIAMALNGGVGVLHKNNSLDVIVDMINTVKMHQFSLDEFKNATIDHNKHLVVGCAIGIDNEELSTTKTLVEAGVDFLVLDSAHAHSANIMQQLQKIKTRFAHIPVIVGNIATKKAALDLIKLGADAVKVGIGPGSICTTRVITGFGVPQLKAVQDVAAVCHKYNIPLIADGGIKYSGDVVKALALGANVVMLGSMLAGTDESPGEVVTFEGAKYKQYMGMGSLKAMSQGSADRYFQSKTKKLVPEGIEALKPYQGSVVDVLYQIVGGLRSGMGYCGASNLSELKTKAEFVQITTSGMKESHPHSLTNIAKTTNY